MKNEIIDSIKAYQSGKLVAIPTETVYGLSAPIDNPKLIEKIFAIKERPFFDPLIVHVSSIEMAKSCCSQWPEIADELAKSFWPGPLTLILPKAAHIQDTITSGLDTVGVRCPNQRKTLELIATLNAPIAAPSANKFGRTSPTSIEHVKKEFSPDDVYFLDGGVCDVGIESTIIKIEDKVLRFLRKGAITSENVSSIAKRFGFEIRFGDDQKIEAPGQIKHHYMPNIPLILVYDQTPQNACELAAQKLNLKAQDGRELALSTDPVIAARTLYSKMREVAQLNGKFMFVVIESRYKNDSLWDAIIDRLTRASTFIC